MTANDVINGALRRLAVLASGETATADEAADALATFNAMCADFFDDIRQLTDYRLTQSYTLRDNDYNFVATGVAVTVTLPQEPREGQRVGVYDGAGNLATYPVTLSANGKRIEGAASVVVNTTGAAKQWFYRADQGWTLIEDVALTDDPILPMHDGLSAMLAIRLADSYGAEVKPLTHEAASAAKSKLKRRFGRPKVVAVDAGVLSLSIQAVPIGSELS